MKKTINCMFAITFLCSLLIYLGACASPNHDGAIEKTEEESTLSASALSANQAAGYPAWEKESIYDKGSRVVHAKHLWEAKWYTKGDEPGTTGEWGVWVDKGPADGSGDPIEPEVLVSFDTPGEVKVVMYKDSEDETSYKGRIFIENRNQVYAWNEDSFCIWNIQFETSSTFTSMKSTNGTVGCTQDQGITTIDLGWQSLIGLGQKVELLYTASKSGAAVFPENLKINYVRGDKTVMYPEYSGLPASFEKNKPSLSAADLIGNSGDYYNSVASAITESFIVYNQYHPSQVRIGQTRKVDYPVNTVNGVRIWIPSKYMAMGVATVYEFFKINPNYMCALGTKENFSAGVVPPSAGNYLNPRIIDGEQWYWPIQLTHIDGPFQQEVGNFSDAQKIFLDYLAPEGKHPDFTQLSAQDDPKWISAALSSGMSISVTRETLNAVKGVGYNEFIKNANDPHAEFNIVTFAYNRGISNFFAKKLFTDNRNMALASQDLCETFNMGGFAAHVPTVRTITEAMNNDTSDIYDAQLSWQEMEAYFAQLRKFYGRQVPSDQEWNAMEADVKRAFDILSAHWGRDTVSFRYDFLTLLRVAKAHLPETNPRPTGEHWYYLVKNAQP